MTYENAKRQLDELFINEHPLGNGQGEHLREASRHRREADRYARRARRLEWAVAVGVVMMAVWAFLMLMSLP